MFLEPKRKPSGLESSEVNERERKSRPFPAFPLGLGGTVSLPISRRQSTVVYLRCRFLQKPSVVLRHLCWHLIFKGTDLRVWYILFSILDFNAKSSSKEECACLFGILSESSKTRKRFENWSSRTRSLRNLLKVELGIESKEKDMTLLKFVVLKLRVPTKGMPLEELVDFEFETRRLKTPPEIRRLGVGYKDKGSINPNSTLELGRMESTSFPLDNFETFIEIWKSLKGEKNKL